MDTFRIPLSPLTSRNTKICCFVVNLARLDVEQAWTSVFYLPAPVCKPIDSKHFRTSRSSSASRQICKAAIPVNGSTNNKSSKGADHENNIFFRVGFSQWLNYAGIAALALCYWRKSTIIKKFRAHCWYHLPPGCAVENFPYLLVSRFQAKSPLMTLWRPSRFSPIL